MKTVKKPWGKEIIWAENSSYVAKMLDINPGQRLSLQYHEVKEETVYVLEGDLLLWSSRDSDPEILPEGSTYHVVPRQIHRFGAGESAVRLVEVSTPYLEDVIRISDDYSRD